MVGEIELSSINKKTWGVEIGIPWEINHKDIAFFHIRYLPYFSGLFKSHLYRFLKLWSVATFNKVIKANFSIINASLALYFLIYY